MTVTDTTEQESEGTKVELGPLFTVGAVLLGLGLLRRRKAAIAAGLGAIWADQRTRFGRDLKTKLKGLSPS